MAAFSRSADRDLIEASCQAWIISTAYHFRDQLIATSLKHGTARPGWGSRRIFSRSADRDLIEAGDSQRSFRRFTHFRDQLIATSLKHDVLEDTDTNYAIFAIS